MANQKHDYTVVTSHGDVHLSTDNHHSLYDSIEEFLAAHKATIAAACQVSGVTISLIGLYLSHGRAGKKLK